MTVILTTTDGKTRTFDRVKALGHHESKPGKLLIVVLANPSDLHLAPGLDPAVIADQVHGTLEVDVSTITDVDTIIHPWPFGVNLSTL